MMSQIQLHHYTNTSVTATTPLDGWLPEYDGKDYYIGGHTTVILVPCNDPQCRKPSNKTCLLVNRSGVQRADETQLLVMYMIDNTNDDGLWLRHGDLLGVPYMDMEKIIYAERSLMMISYYTDLITEQSYDDDDEMDGVFYFSAPPCSPTPMIVDAMRSPQPLLDIIDEIKSLNVND